MYKIHTQTASLRYTHGKSSAKIDILQALRLPSADKHCLWVNTAHTPWDSATFCLPLPSSVNVLNKASHQERRHGFKGNVVDFLIWLSMQCYCSKNQQRKSLTLKTVVCWLILYQIKHESLRCCLMVLHYEYIDFSLSEKKNVWEANKTCIFNFIFMFPVDFFGFLLIHICPCNIII